MPTAKLKRIPTMRDRVEDTLSAHRNELVCLLSRFSFFSQSQYKYMFLYFPTKSLLGLCYFFERYVAQGKGMLQPHHLIDELDKVICDNKAHLTLCDGPFGEVIKSAQVISLTLMGLFDTFCLNLYGCLENCRQRYESYDNLESFLIKSLF